MILKSLKIQSFKNLEEKELQFSQKLNCFTGNNGAGKTNILDALYYLSFTKSYFNTSDQQNVKYGHDFFVLKGEYEINEKIETIYCAYSSAKKKIFKRNDKAYKKFSEHIGLLPAVIISPDDILLISGSAEERRKYIDSVISQYDKSYLYELIRYNKILSQRNRLLKNFNLNGYFDKDTIDVYNDQLHQSGTDIFEKRTHFVKKLIPVFNSYYEKISLRKEQVDLKYMSHLYINDLKELLRENEERDKVLGYTSKGIHRDDLNFEINAHSLRKTGSQGQQKSFLTALKFAQFEFIKEQSQIKPILLLDDVFDKFDSERVEEIIKLTGDDNFGQIFITDTNPARVRKLVDGEKDDFKIFHVNKGRIADKHIIKSVQKTNC
jgi:DNA replication and repair protein RecF